MTPRRTRPIAVAGLAALVAFAGWSAACNSLESPTLYGSIEVHAARLDGTPIAGADLILYSGQRVMGYGVTAADGAYTYANVPEGIYGVRIVPPEGYVRREEVIAGPPSDFVDRLRLSGGETLPVNFSLLKRGPGAIVAQISESDGTPVAGIPVTLYTGTGPLRTAETDASGRSAFENVPFGNYGVRAPRPVAYLDIGEDPLPARDGILVEEGSRETATFVFDPCAGSVTVAVLDDLNRGVPGATLTLYTSQAVIGDAVTGADGTHAFTSLTCTEYGVRVRVPPGWSAPEGRGTSFMDGLRVNRGSALSTTLRAQVCMAAVRVRVNDDTGAPVANASIQLYAADSIYRVVSTAADGQVTMSDVPCDREYGVRATPPAGYTVAEGPGSSYFDGITVSNGVVVERTFTFTRVPAS